MDNCGQEKFPQAHARDIVPDEEPSTCTPCGESFITWDLYHKHKITHPSHRGKTCIVCSRDFNTAAACKTHSLQLHAQKQNLNCPACQMHFSRLGSLIHHLEQRLCRESTEGKFSDRVRERNKFYDNDLNVRNMSEYGATSGDFMNDTDQPISRATGPKSGQGTSGDFAVGATDQIVRSTDSTNFEAIIEPERKRPEKKKFEYKQSDGKPIDPIYCMPKLKLPVDEQPEFDGDAMIYFDSPPRLSPQALHANFMATAVSKPTSEGWSSPSVEATVNQGKVLGNKQELPKELPQDLRSENSLVDDSTDLMSKLDAMIFNEINPLEGFDEVAYFRDAPPHMSKDDVNTSMRIVIANGGKIDRYGRYEYFTPASPSPPAVKVATKYPGLSVTVAPSMSHAQVSKGLQENPRTLWSTPQDPWAKPTSAAEKSPASLSPKPPQLPSLQATSSQSSTWGPGKTALEVNAALTERHKKTTLDEPTHNPWGSESAHDSWGSDVKDKEQEVNANFSADPSDPSFRSEAYWIQALGKYKCPHKACKKSFEKKMPFLTHLKSAAHMGVQERLQCRKCLDWFGSATALAQHAESQGLCILRDSDQYTRCVDEFTAGYAAPAGRNQDSTVRYVVNPDKKGNVDPTNISAKVIERHRTLDAEKMKMEEKYWDAHNPKW